MYRNPKEFTDQKNLLEEGFTLICESQFHDKIDNIPENQGH